MRKEEVTSADTVGPSVLEDLRNLRVWKWIVSMQIEEEVEWKDNHL